VSCIVTSLSKHELCFGRYCDYLHSVLKQDAHELLTAEPRPGSRIPPAQGSSAAAPASTGALFGPDPTPCLPLLEAHTWCRPHSKSARSGRAHVFPFALPRLLTPSLDLVGSMVILPCGRKSCNRSSSFGAAGKSGKKKAQASKPPAVNYSLFAEVSA
jgi:hypothetical protein